MAVDYVASLDMPGLTLISWSQVCQLGPDQMKRVA